MKLLITTQAVDELDPALGFFVRWIAELSALYESIEVICLYEGTHALPSNVRVHSLGKEKGRKGRISYALQYLWLAWRLRRHYDLSFVHMNQEYLLIAGWFWKLTRKPAYLWRNHYAGSWQTDSAALFCRKVFCTSKYSYTARYRKTVLMPVGVDTDTFHPNSVVTRTPRSILFLARMAPSKRPEMLLEALCMLKGRGIDFTATFIGDPPADGAAFYTELESYVLRHELGEHVAFLPSVAHHDAPAVFAAHQIFVNCSRSGMFDKTLFEAAASGCHVLTTSDDFTRLVPDAGFGSAKELVERLSLALDAPHPVPVEVIESNSLTALARKMREYLV